MKTPKARSQITASQRRYLYRQFLRLYLYSKEAQKDFDCLIDKDCELERILTESEQSAPLPVQEPTDENQPEQLLEAKPKPKRDYAKLFTDRRLRNRLILMLSLLGLVVVGQLLYPHDRALPLARLQSNGFVGFSTKQDILGRFQDFESRTLTVHTHNKNLTTSYTDLGVTLRPDSTVESLTSYSLAERLIPFSIFFVGNKTFTMERDLNEPQLALFARDIIAQTNEAPQNAHISLEGTRLVLVPSRNGSAYQLSYLKSQVLRSGLENKAQIVFKPAVLNPDIPTEAVTLSVEMMQQRINNGLSIVGEGQIMTIKPETIASWLDISPQPGGRTISLAFNKTRVTDSVRAFARVVDKPQRPHVITTLNSAQAGSTTGTPGKSLQLNELVDKVVAATDPATQTIEAPITTISPKTEYDRRYTKDNAGLQNLLDYWTSNHSGRYSVDVRTSNGRIEANINAYQLSSSVGIYRLFIAHNIYGQIMARSISSSTSTSAGLGVDSCLDRMIRESDDACTTALGDLVGWGASDDLLHTQGFENTTLAQGASLTTANDTSDWLIKLLEGSIVSRSQIDSLTGLMKRSSVRSGIPAGSKGITVANKAGSFGRVKNDVGIVYHPKGTYVLSILADGGNFSDIADLASEINKVMDQ